MADGPGRDGRPRRRAGGFRQLPSTERAADWRARPGCRPQGDTRPWLTTCAPASRPCSTTATPSAIGPVFTGIRRHGLDFVAHEQYEHSIRAALDSVGRHGQCVLQRGDVNFDVHELTRPELVLGIGKGRFQVQRAAGWVDGICPISSTAAGIQDGGAPSRESALEPPPCQPPVRCCMARHVALGDVGDQRLWDWIWLITTVPA